MSAKTWEEEWKHHGGSAVYGPGNEVISLFATLSDPEDPCEDEKRARLAAAAPEMARLLLELQFVDTSNGEYTETCPCCAYKTYGNREPGMSGIPVDFHPGRHADDCDLLAVLRKAGCAP